MTNFEIKETENNIEIVPMDPNPEKEPAHRARLGHASDRRRHCIRRLILWNPLAALMLRLACGQ